MIIKNGTVLLGDFKLSKCDVKVRDGIITEIGENLTGDCIFDADGKYVVPGLIDEHFHGANGYAALDCSADSFVKIAEFEAKNGVTSIVPTLSSYPKEVMLNCIKALNTAKKQKYCGADILGIHLEGPFLCSKYRGAHREEYLQKPNTELLKECLKAANGNIKLITIAPELENAVSVIKFAKENNITVSIGHSAADYFSAKAAVDAGATVSTHTFNAMVLLHHRNKGILDEALLDERVCCEVIGDFGHVSENIVKLVYRLKGANNMAFVSDSTKMAGLPDGKYEAEEHICTVKDGISRFEDGTINGSATTVLTSVKNALKIGIPFCDAVKMASATPAKNLNVYNTCGSIDKGKKANIIISDESININAVFVNGERIKK